jgi:hypothetical protein
MNAPVKELPKIRLDPATGIPIYEPDGVTLYDFVVDNSEVAVIRGPLGSGKSFAWCQRIFRHAREQSPSPMDGVRRSRWIVVRNTYPQLKTTTIKTWLDAFPEHIYGKFNWGIPHAHRIRVGDVDLEVYFLALDKAEDVAKLRSLEVTGVCFNELQYIPKELFDEAHSRVGRFPAVKDGGCRWKGVIADMNEPDEDHFIPLMTGEVPFPDGMSQEERDRLQWPSDWFYRIQPPGLIEVYGDIGQVIGYRENPLAENRKWLYEGYYLDKSKGKAKAWVDSRLLNKINLFAEGDPVHPAFRAETHMARSPLHPMRGYPILCGMDFGRSPALLCGQFINNRWYILNELIGFNEGASIFAPKVKRWLEQNFAGHTYEFWGDPKGQDRGQADERTAYEIFRSYGMAIRPAPVKQNAIQTRLDAVDYALTTMWEGGPRLLISPTCRMYRAALAGKYCWKKDDEGRKEPDKNKHSHIADAGQYLLLGGGEGRTMVNLTPGHKPKGIIVSRPRGVKRRV